MTYGEQVKQARIARGLTLDQAAEITGVSQANLSKIERGVVTNITMRVAHSIKHGLGVEIPEAVQAPLGSEPERVFETRWTQCAGADVPPFVREYAFDATHRQWRLDFAWPDAKIGVEIHGGEWSHGRHVRGAGFIEDRRKMNAALAQGWRVFEFTTTMLKTDPCGCVAQVLGVLARRRGVVEEAA